MTHTLSRTMKWLRDQDYVGDKIEMPWNPYTKKRKDFLGIGDALFFKGSETLLVQACGAGELAAHERKIRKSPYLASWLEGGHRGILLIGWGKRVARNKDGKKSKVKRWTPRVLSIPELSPVLSE